MALTREHKLLLAYDALVLGQVLGRDIAVGQLIHGDDHAVLKVKTSALAGEVRKRLEKIVTVAAVIPALNDHEIPSVLAAARAAGAGLHGDRPAPVDRHAHLRGMIACSHPG